MKILLIGEFSGFHTALKKGLAELGHQVTLAGTGDGFKEIPVDINYYPKRRYAKHKIFYSFLKQFTIPNKLRNAKGYDVVQFISPTLFRNSLVFYSNIFNRKIYNHLIKNNKYSFLVSCGSDPVFHQIGKTQLRYNPLDAEKKYQNIDYAANENPVFLNWNIKLAAKVNGVIPATYSYYIGYAQVTSYPINLSPVIPMPIICSDYEYKPNRVVNNKIRILHGISRPGYKGTEHIVNALNRIEKKYPNLVEVTITKRLSLVEYLKYVSNTNILIDQCNSYCYGINALIGLAMGKIVLSGAEPEHISALNIKECPVVNIKPDSNHIYNQIENIIQTVSTIEQHGEWSRKFVEQQHDAKVVAKRYLSFWNKSTKNQTL